MRYTMDFLYQEVIIDHYRNPRNKGTLVNPDFASKQHNPSCGDSISWQARVIEGRIVELGFEGAGCVISQATASLLSEYVLNKLISEVNSLDSAFILSLIKIPLGPTRLKCALLSLDALKGGLRQLL